MSPVLTRHAPEPVLRLRSVVVPVAAIVFFVVLFFGVLRLVESPAMVGRVSVDNRTSYDLEVGVTDGSNRDRLLLAALDADATTRVEDVLDQGSTWLFRVSRAGDDPRDAGAVAGRAAARRLARRDPVVMGRSRRGGPGLAIALDRQCATCTDGRPAGPQGGAARVLREARHRGRGRGHRGVDLPEVRAADGRGRLARARLARRVRRAGPRRHRPADLRRGVALGRRAAPAADAQQRRPDAHVARDGGAEARVPAPHPARRAALRDRVHGAEGGHRPRVARDPRRARRRRVRHQRPEDLHQRDPGRRLRVARGAHRSVTAQAQGPVGVHRADDARPGSGTRRCP